MSSVIFDLDGTLIDSAPDLQAAANRMLAEEGQPPLDLATITSFIGNGLPKLVERVMQARGLPAPDHARLAAATLAHYSALNGELTVLYPGVRAALDALAAQGLRIGLCTNKPVAPARDVLAHFGLLGHFAVVIGGDSLAVTKPDAAPLLAARDALGGGPAVYVGDSEVDAATAQAAGLPFALYTEGYRKLPVDQMPHDATFDSFSDLPGVVARLMPAPGGTT